MQVTNVEVRILFQITESSEVSGRFSTKTEMQLASFCREVMLVAVQRLVRIRERQQEEEKYKNTHKKK